MTDLEAFDLSKFNGNVERGPLKGGKHCFAEPDGSAFLLKGIDFPWTGKRVSSLSVQFELKFGVIKWIII